jgi:hypothetical protein
MPQAITLEYPVTFGGQEYKTLTMRRPKVRDDLASQSAPTKGEQEVVLFATLCGVPPDVIRDLDQAADYVRLQDLYNGFFVSPRKTSVEPGQ